jgi:hypothetical protein
VTLLDKAKAQTVFGDYVTTVWWPTWKAQHPDSAYCVGKRLEKRILPAFGNLPFATLDADRIGAWKAQLTAEGLKPTTVNTYLSLLGTILIHSVANASRNPGSTGAVATSIHAYSPPSLPLRFYGHPPANCSPRPARAGCASAPPRRPRRWPPGRCWSTSAPPASAEPRARSRARS